MNSLVSHFHKFGKITEDSVQSYIHQEDDHFVDQNEDVLVFGTKGIKIIPKTANQKKLVEQSRKNDLVFAVALPDRVKPIFRLRWPSKP